MRSRHIPESSIPRTQLLSNGRYNLMMTNAGGGYSRWENSALTRWREDVTRDDWGAFFYIRDRDDNNFWSGAFQPTLRSEPAYQAHFSGAAVTLDCDAFDIGAHTDVAVAQDDDVELRRITVTNRTDRSRSLDLTSYAEVVLAPSAADDAHPAFSKLFIQTEIIPAAQAIVCRRRPGGADQAEPWLFHMAIAGGSAATEISYETDRMRFIGRGNTVANPQAMSDPAPLSGTQGSVLDPVVAIRCPVALAPGQSVTVTYLFGVGETREACLALIKKYSAQDVVDRAIENAAAEFRKNLQRLKATPKDVELYGRLADSIVYGNAALRAGPAIIIRNQRGQSGLWGFSVSGDLPIVLLQLGESPDLDLTRELLRAHTYWRQQGLRVDLVICNARNLTGRQALQDQVVALMSAQDQTDLLDKPGGVFVCLQKTFSPEDLVLFQAVARVVLDDGAGSLARQLDHSASEAAVPARPGSIPMSDVSFDNGVGAFSADGREYVITLEPGQTTPAPWVNILANPQFGTLVSESGCANTWSENAHEFLLTPWSNDPVGDSTGEAFYLRDEDTGLFWSPTPWPCRGLGQYRCRHGFGYSVFTHEQDGIASELQIYVARDAPIKFAVLKIRNQSGRLRRLSATGYIEWVLGDQRTKTMAHVTTRVDPDTGALIGQNPYSMEFGDRLAFFTVDDAARTITGDRTEFLGRNGSPRNPAAMQQTQLGGKLGAALDPCAAIQIPFELDNNHERELVFKLGAGSSEDEIRTLIKRFKGSDAAHDALSDVSGYWRRTLGAVSIETPDAALNRLGNGWLIYQVLACRLWGRTAFYQSSGAFGFRDQLQDVMALVHVEPGLVRAHLLLCASRQYEEGDVQHWWHPPAGRGVRTRCSDDYLWLPLAVCRYVSTTGDTGILDEQAAFLTGRLLNTDEESYYELPGRSDDTATLYEHCVRAVRNGLRFGVHGLPLMGTGDWNDGMNKVGAKGKGESIWLGFFLHEVLGQFSKIAQARGDDAFAAQCEKEAGLLARNLEQHGWDGAWFRRAYFDDGSVLGSAENSECQIDSIAQSWSVLSGATGAKRARMAMQAVDRHLVDRDGAVIKLLAPPFDTSVPDPGYIKAYVPGVRENGGQYTHAAVWSVMAFAALDDNARAWELLSILNPINHATSPDSAALYKVEPYVVASDVYALAPHTGRGGWTWYSGSAGWLYRLILESVLGLRREADKLYVEPCIPTHWESFKIHYSFGKTAYSIEVRQQIGAGVDARLSVDGIVQDAPYISLIDDGRDHQAQVCIIARPLTGNEAR